MYNIRTILSLLAFLLLMSACEDENTGARIAAYNAATAEVCQAKDSEELLEISYRLHLELEKVKIEDESTALAKARQEFEAAVKSKEIEIYSYTNKKK